MIDAPPTLFRKLWIYQAERFPVARAGLLLAIFTASSISVSAGLAQRPDPRPWTFCVAWLVTLMIFFQLRASDEVKDREDDARYRPERPIPRGLVGLRLVVGLGIACIPVAICLVGTLNFRLLGPLVAVWLWLTLMGFEFFAPTWLKARPFLYLVSHMAIMPLIDFFVTSTEWLPHGLSPPRGLGWFLGLSFANGCVLEIGRKVWAPENEREGVETYSSLVGPRRAAWLWVAALVAAYGLLVGVGVSVGAPLVVALLGACALAVVVSSAAAFARAPTPARQKRIDALAGLWVFACYGVAGLAPRLFRGGL